MKTKAIRIPILAIAALLSAALLISSCGADEGGSGQTEFIINAETEGDAFSDVPSADPSQEEPGAASGENFSAGSFPFTFTAVDLYGNTVTDRTLGEKRLFFIHYWATWCPPCVAEMPELAKIAEDYADEVGFIALLADYGDNLKGAQNLAESSGVPDTFIMVDAETPELAGLLAMVQSGYVPTSVILDVNGEMTGSQLIGAYGEKYAEILDTLLNE